MEEGEALAREYAREIREHGHRLIDAMAAYLEGVGERPVSTSLQPRELAARFAEEIPSEGSPAEEVWDRVWMDVVGDAIRLHHPMYIGHQVAPPLPQAVLADALASLLNQSIAVWEMSPTGTLVEEQVVRWLIDLLGYPDAADGTLVSGGSAANLTALLAAREARFPGAWKKGAGAMPEGAVVLVSPHAHYSVERAAGLMGLGTDAVLPVPGREGVMDPDALERMLVEMRATGRVPLAVVGTAGSTATGAFDPLDAIAEVAHRCAVWMHVDAAHGASFLLSPTHRHLLRGIERADSVAWDPHKMMFLPISTGVVLLRDRRHLDATFQQSAPYLFHIREGEHRSRDTGNRTLQCSRRFDALKLWVALRVYGADHFGRMIDRTVATTRYLHARLAEEADFEPMHEPHANILCFRHLPEGVGGLPPEGVDAFQAELRAAYNASGEGWITSTVLEGRRVLRVTLINPATGEAEVERLLAGLRAAGEGIR
jgi:L-2,4-diaminobutyrate decarboxylase